MAATQEMVKALAADKKEAFDLVEGFKEELVDAMEGVR